MRLALLPSQLTWAGGSFPGNTPGLLPEHRSKTARDWALGRTCGGQKPTGGRWEGHVFSLLFPLEVRTEEDGCP